MKSNLLPPINRYPETEAFWDAANDNRLMLRHCPACQETSWYPRTHCPLCGAEKTEWLQASGRGSIYSFSIVRAARRPTAAAVVALPEGPSMTAVVVDSDVHAMRIGDPVVLRFLQAEGGQQVPAFTTVAAEQARQYSQRALAAAREVPGLPDLPAGFAWRGAAVVGAGNMGSGIATALIAAGLRVCLIDREEAALQRARDTVAGNLESLARRGRLPEGLAPLDEMLRTSTRMADVAGANLIIEAVWESMALKKTVFGELDRHADADALLATNTSTLDIDEIARSTARPESVLGLHFFSPAHVMGLLELVRGERTRADFVAAGLDLGRRMRKTTVVVGVCHGFVGNRLFIARDREAVRLLYEGALPEQIDRVLTEFGLPMGTFDLADMGGGIELGYRARQDRGEVEPVGDRLFLAGRLGQRTGKGFYRYEPGKRRPLPDPEVTQIIEAVSREMGIERRRFTDDELRERLILPMINEGAKLVEEGMVLRASDIDVVWQKGFGWPDWKGGPMYHADRLGLAAVHERLLALQERHGERFRPAELLRVLAAQGRTFTGELAADTAAAA